MTSLRMMSWSRGPRGLVLVWGRGPATLQLRGILDYSEAGEWEGLMASSSEARRRNSNGNRYREEAEAGGDCQGLMACSRSLVIWSLSREGLILLDLAKEPGGSTALVLASAVLNLVLD